MTACTNNGGSRARRAVTAALVGVLSVGAAPMVALATNAAEPANGEVQVLANQDAAFINGTVSYENGEDGDSFVYNSGKYLVPEQVNLENNGGKVTGLQPLKWGGSNQNGHYYFYVKIDDKTEGSWSSKVTYTKDGKEVSVRGTTISSNVPTEVGTYAVLVGHFTNGNADYYVAKADTFTITNGSFEGAQLIDNNVVGDYSFAYTGLNDADTWSNGTNSLSNTMGVELDGKALVKGQDYEFGAVWETGSTHTIDATKALKVGQSYTVEVIGMNGYDGVSEKLTFTYEALNLDNASVVSVGAVDPSSMFDTNDPSSVVESINGVSVSANYWLEDKLTVKMTSAPEDEGTGVYTFEVAPKAGQEYVTGKAEVTVVYADVVAGINYGTQDWDTAFPNGTFDVDLTLEEPVYFDVDEISVDRVAGKKVDHTVTVKDAVSGAGATVDDLTEYGKWLVTVTVDGTVDGKSVADSKSVVVNNTYGVTEATDMFVSFNGQNIVKGGKNTGTDYNATDLTSKLSVKVVSGDITFTEGDDYTVSIDKQDVTGKWVATDKIEDAGTYRVTVKGVKFGESGQYFIEIGKRDLNAITPSNAFAVEDVMNNAGTVVTGHVYYYAYTGEEIAPEFTFVGDDGNTYVVPADEFEVTYNKDELKNKGDYVINSVKLDSANFDNADAVAITLAGTSKIVVTETGSFVDVPNDAWYAEEVAIAKQQGYIGGVGGTNFFAPMNDITRADFVCVLYRMAGGKIGSVEEGMTNEELSYISSFEDVDPNAYYAKAVAWATKMGIVNGYGTTFGTERSISTEEFAAMLARYAAKMGTDTTVDADAVLADVADGDEVSSYARDAVAWAVESGYLAKGGNLIDPQGSIYRARAIKIAVDYQPEQLDTILGQGGTAQDKQ